MGLVIFKVLSYNNLSLRVESLTFLGVDLKDLENLSIKPNYLFELSENDLKKALSLLGKPFMKDEPLWKEQVRQLVCISPGLPEIYLKTVKISHTRALL